MATLAVSAPYFSLVVGDSADVFSMHPPMALSLVRSCRRLTFPDTVDFNHKLKREHRGESSEGAFASCTSKHISEFVQ